MPLSVLTTRAPVPDEVNVIRLATGEGPEEGYRLDIRPGTPDITAISPAGVFYGVQTLRQMLPSVLERKDGAPALGRTTPRSGAACTPSCHGWTHWE